MVILKKIWPTMKRIIDAILYFIFHLFKVVVSRSIAQIRGRV